MSERLAIAEPVKRDPAYVENDRLQPENACLQAKLDLALELLRQAMGMRI